jgi:hypothetical protein
MCPGSSVFQPRNLASLIPDTFLYSLNAKLLDLTWEMQGRGDNSHLSTGKMTTRYRTTASGAFPSSQAGPQRLVRSLP